MNREDMDAFVRHLSIDYAQNDPIAFDEKIVELGGILGKMAKSHLNMAMANEHSTEELHVVLGYYSSNIDEVGIYEKRKSYPAYVQLNILTFEFLSDCLLFEKYPDRDHCVYIFSKYRKNMDNAAHRSEYAAYYNKLYRNFQYQPTFDWWNYAPLASNSLHFLLLHEWAHTRRLELSRTFDLFQMFNSTILSKLDGSILDDEEIACDFVALTLLDGALRESKSAGNALRIALQTLAFIPLYSVILSFIHGGNDEYVNRDLFDEQLDVMDERLKIRLPKLSYAIEIARSVGGFFQSIQPKSVTEDAYHTVQAFYERLADFWSNELLPGFDAFTAQAIEERQKYYLSQNVSPLIQIY